MISLIMLHENFPVAPIGGSAQQVPTTSKNEKPPVNNMQQVADRYAQMIQQMDYPQLYPPYMYPPQNQMIGYGAALAAPTIASVQQDTAKKVEKPAREKSVELTTSEFLKKKLDKKRQLAKKKLNNTVAFLKPFGLGAATALAAQALKQQYHNSQSDA